MYDVDKYPPHNLDKPDTSNMFVWLGIGPAVFAGEVSADWWRHHDSVEVDGRAGTGVRVSEEMSSGNRARVT